MANRRRSHSDSVTFSVCTGPRAAGLAAPAHQQGGQMNTRTGRSPQLVRPARGRRRTSRPTRSWLATTAVGVLLIAAALAALARPPYTLRFAQLAVPSLDSAAAAADSSAPQRIDQSTVEGGPSAMRVMSLSDAQATVPRRAEQLADRHTRWLTAHSGSAERPATEAGPSVASDLPPPPDAPGGQLAVQRDEGGAQ
jgi:hypothetical protein